MANPWHKQFKRAAKERRTYKNIVFDSLMEMEKYKNCELMQLAGEIKNLKVHVQHELKLPDGTPILTRKGKISYYESDIEYDDALTGSHIIIDVKGYMTRDSAFRIAVFEAITKKKVTIAQ